MRNIVGPQVREARLAHNPKLTQEDLAARLQVLEMNIDRAGVAKIEIGLRKVCDMEVVKLAEALGVTAAWLLGEE